jgi:hypothetical protein
MKQAPSSVPSSALAISAFMSLAPVSSKSLGWVII